MLKWKTLMLPIVFVLILSIGFSAGKSDFVKMIKNVVDFKSYTIYEVCNPSPQTLSIGEENRFGIEFVNSSRIPSNIHVEFNTTKNETTYPYITQCLSSVDTTRSDGVHYQRCFLWNTTPVYNITEVWSGLEKFNWNNVAARTCWKVKVSADLTTGAKVDNIASFSGYTFPEYAWWNLSFPYCMNLNITTTGASAPNSALNISIPYLAGMNRTFEDLRIVNASCNQDGASLVTHWVAFNVTSSYANVYVNTSGIAGATTVQWAVYYGNMTTPSLSDLATLMYAFNSTATSNNSVARFGTTTTNKYQGAYAPELATDGVTPNNVYTNSWLAPDSSGYPLYLMVNLSHNWTVVKSGFHTSKVYDMKTYVLQVSYDNKTFTTAISDSLPQAADGSSHVYQNSTVNTTFLPRDGSYFRFNITESWNGTGWQNAAWVAGAGEVHIFGFNVTNGITYSMDVPMNITVDTPKNFSYYTAPINFNISFVTGTGVRNATIRINMTNGWCGQLFANVTPSCFFNTSGGEYGMSGTNGSWRDGNEGTYSARSSTAGNDYMYENVTMEEGVNSTVVLHLKSGLTTGATTANYSLKSGCYQPSYKDVRGNPILAFRHTMREGGTTDSAASECWNSTDSKWYVFANITGSNRKAIWEMTVYFLPAYSTMTNTTIANNTYWNFTKLTPTSNDFYDWNITTFNMTNYTFSSGNMFFYYGTAPETSTCTYSGSGDWFIRMSDNCTISANTKITGELKINGTGGVLNIRANVTANRIAMIPSSYIRKYMIFIDKSFKASLGVIK